MEYKLVSSETESELELLVNEKLRDGFRPVGGVSVVRYESVDERKGFSTTKWFYAQALVKDVKEEISSKFLESELFSIIRG